MINRGRQKSMGAGSTDVWDTVSAPEASPADADVLGNSDQLRCKVQRPELSLHSRNTCYQSMEAEEQDTKCLIV